MRTRVPLITLSSAGGYFCNGFGLLLQIFPLMHQVAELPHQRLMAIDQRLRTLLTAGTDA